MRATMIDQTKVALQLLVVAVLYSLLSVALLGSAEGAWRIPAMFVLVFFLPVLASSSMQFYWQLCRPVWRKLVRAV